MMALKERFSRSREPIQFLASQPDQRNLRTQGLPIREPEGSALLLAVPPFESQVIQILLRGRYRIQREASLFRFIVAAILARVLDQIKD